MKKIRNLFCFIVFIGIIFLFSNYSNASQSLNDLQFDIQVMSNGNVMITEYWDINMYDVNTLFKSFKRDSKFKELTEVSVAEVDEYHNTLTVFQNSGEYNYHETKDYFHATDDDNGYFEIAWGVSVEGSEHKYYKISYIIKDCINVYADCAEFYWQIIGDEWQVESDRVHGTVSLPKEVDNYEEFRVWAHGPLNGQILKDDSKTCSFTVDNMPTKKFLELRIVFPTDIVPNSNSIKDELMLDKILKEEQRNADKANAIRKISESKEKIFTAIFVVVSGLCGIHSVVRLKNIKGQYNEASKIEGNYDYEYFRDIPNDKMSPVTAAVLENEKIEKKNAFSSLMMSLAQKNWISITPGEKKDNTIITLNIKVVESKDEVSIENRRELLTEDEQRTLDYLARVGTEFSLKEFEKYTSSHESSFYNYLDNLHKIANKELTNEYKYIDSKNQKLKDKLVEMSLMSIFWLMMEGTFIMSAAAFIMASNEDSAKIPIFFKVVGVISAIYIFGAIMAAVYCKKISKYTEVGAEERAKWKGLKKFMSDFSLIDEREVPELALWDKYLVYATAFGIADKVIKQLKTKFPELNDDSFTSNNYRCIYMASHSNLYTSSFNKSVSAAESYHARQVSSSYSSGSGGGGGFSGGGGGGRRRRRPEVAAKPNRPNRAALF